MASRESFGKIGSDDDWEEIADNYSVKSLSSDDEEDEKPAASPALTRSKVDSSPPRSQTSPIRHAPQVNASHDANDTNVTGLGHALSKVDIGIESAPRATSPVSVDKMAAIKTSSASKPRVLLPPSQQDMRRPTASSPREESQRPQDLTRYPGAPKSEDVGRYTKAPPATTDNGTISKYSTVFPDESATPDYMPVYGSPPPPLPAPPCRGTRYPYPPPGFSTSATQHKRAEVIFPPQPNGSKTSEVSNEPTCPILPCNDVTQELGSWKQSTMGRFASAPFNNKNPQESGSFAQGAKVATARGTMLLDNFNRQERKPEEMVSQCGTSLGVSTHDTVLANTLDLDETSTDPVVINNALLSLSRMLRDTSPALCIMHLKHATKVLPACKSLLAQVDSLRPILAVYAAKYNQPTATARDVPLDPSLMMWIASLSRTLWEIGFEFKIVESNNPGSSSPKRAPSLETLVGELESAAKQMDEFLPIIQADFAEFQKKQKPVFPASTAAPEPNHEINTPNDYQRPRIRQTMYGLKKELQHAISILKGCQRWLPDPAKVIVGDVTNGMSNLFDVVGGIMASNGPAWFEGPTSETGRPRLITHSEFGNLDPIVIEDYSARIQQICGLVHIDAAESRAWSEEMIREHHVCMLIEQQQIDSLEHIVSVCKGMLLR